MAQEYFSIALTSDISLAISLDSIDKIIQLETPNICNIPGVSDFWYGVVNFKGSLLWILDSNRYFNLKIQKQQSVPKTLASVVIKHQQKDNQKRVAIVTSKLESIITVKPQELEQVPENIEANIKNCCANFLSNQNKRTFILNSANLLGQLHHKSSLLSA